MCRSKSFQIDEKERYSKTRLLTTGRKFNYVSTKPLFDWESPLIKSSLKNTSHEFNNTIMLGSSVRNGTLEAKKIQRKLRQKFRKLKKKYMSQNMNNTQPEQFMRRRKKKKKTNKLKLLNATEANRNEVFVWKLKETKLEADQNKKRNRINIAVNNTTNNLSFQASKKLLDHIQNTTPLSKRRGDTVVSTVSISKEEHIKDENNKQFISSATPKLINTQKKKKESNPLLHTQTNHSNFEPVRNELNTFYFQENKSYLRKDVLRSKLLKSRCSINNGGCDHFCHDTGSHMCSCLEGFILEKDGRRCTG